MGGAGIETVPRDDGQLGDLFERFLPWQPEIPENCK